jgi:hypothetical protein
VIGSDAVARSRFDSGDAGGGDPWAMTAKGTMVLMAAIINSRVW